MGMTLNNERIIELAFERNLTSENLTEVFDLEEIIAIKNLLNISKHIFLESFLLSNIDKSKNPLSEEYLQILSNKKQIEENLILETVSTIEKSFKTAPEEILNFLNFYAMDSLNSDLSKVVSDISKLLDNPENVKFINDLEAKLNFENSVLALDLLKAIKLRYSDAVESYYINLLAWYSKYISLGLLYIFIEN